MGSVVSFCLCLHFMNCWCALVIQVCRICHYQDFYYLRRSDYLFISPRALRYAFVFTQKEHFSRVECPSPLMGFTIAAMLQAGVLVHLVRVDPEVTTCSGQSKQCRVCASGSWLKPNPKC